MERPQVSDATILQAIEALTVKIGQKIEEHGRGAYLSHHEGLGIVTEEYDELLDAVRSNNPVDVAEELFDVAVGALWSVISMMDKEERLKTAQAELEKTVNSLKEEVAVNPS